MVAIVSPFTWRVRLYCLRNATHSPRKMHFPIPFAFLVRVTVNHSLSLSPAASRVREQKAKCFLLTFTRLIHQCISRDGLLLLNAFTEVYKSYIWISIHIDTVQNLTNCFILAPFTIPFYIQVFSAQTYTQRKWEACSYRKYIHSIHGFSFLRVIDEVDTHVTHHRYRYCYCWYLYTANIIVIVYRLWCW